jgi:hypothetical protein
VEAGAETQEPAEDQEAQPQELGATSTKAEGSDAEGRVAERGGPRQEDAFRRRNPDEAQEVIGTAYGVVGIRKCHKRSAPQRLQNERGGDDGGTQRRESAPQSET